MGEKSEHEPPEGGAEAERQIATLRGRIDALDEEILALVARRLDVVDDIALVKREAGLPIRDAQRERTLLESREGSARKLQLPDDLVESLFRLLMWASRDRQAQQSARLSADTIR